MVLTLERAACVALLVGLSGLSGVSASAQQPATANAPRTGEVRPLLYGFALECIDCAPGEHGRGRSGGGGGGQPPVLSYRTFPHVIAVAPGSAAEQAGIKPGDVLHSIDGLSVIGDAGAERLARAAAGEQVRLAFERNAKPVVVSLTLGATASAQRRGGPQRIYGGYVALQGAARGNVKLEIWSDEPIVPTDSTGSMVMRIGNSTVIRLQLTKDSTDATHPPK